MAESKQEKAARIAAEKKNVSRKLDPIHKIVLYVSAAILAVGKLVYSVGVLDTQSLNAKAMECIYVPSEFDIMFNDALTGASLVFLISLFTAVNFYESR